MKTLTRLIEKRAEIGKRPWLKNSEKDSAKSNLRNKMELSEIDRKIVVEVLRMYGAGELQEEDGR